MSVGPVLIVEDNPAIREMVGDALQAAGYPVVEAADGQEALDLATICQPALILLDLNVPVVSGFSFIDAVEDRDIRAPILLLTADPRAPNIATDDRVVGYLAKPFDLDALLGAVSDLLHARHHDDEAVA